jgi:hypothetical protein
MSKSVWTLEKVMFYARDRFGLSGETRREFPATDKNEASTHEFLLSQELRVAVRSLLARGYIEARVRVSQVPTERGGLFNCAAHTLRATTYHATPEGLDAWIKGTL